ncbi:MAG: HDOD domain-containing protein [Vicinamibacterales bacterium]
MTTITAQRVGDGTAWIAWLESGQWERALDRAGAMLPALAVEIVRLAQDPEVAPLRITDVVSKDPVLAAHVVRMANSAASASAMTITSLNEAVVRVGTQAVRQLVTATCLTSKLRNPKIYGAHGRDLVDHCIGTAYLSWLVADHVDGDSDEAFLFGLLHDIGKFVMLKLANEDRPLAPGAMSTEQFDELIAARHAGIGGRALARWAFAPAVQVPVAFHHAPALAGAEHRRGAAIAYVANCLAHRYGFGCPADDSNLLEDEVFVYLGVNESFLKELDARAPGLFEVARKITS